MRSILLKTGSAHMNNKIFDIDDPMLNRDNVLKPYVMLRDAMSAQGVSLNTVDMGNEETCEKIIIFDLSKENYYYLLKCIKNGWQEKLLLVIWEGSVIVKRNWQSKLYRHFEKIFTWSDELVDNKKYFKIFYPQPELPFYGFKESFSNKKLCTVISSNRMSKRSGSIYAKRFEAIKFFEENSPENFDLYGTGWNKPSTKWQKWFPSLMPYYKSYQGPVVEKGMTFSKYKFAICYENQSMNGYITEKIFDCFKGGCVPVYLGAENITDFVPPNTFIDKRNFNSYQELLIFLQSMNEVTYNQYITNIYNYLQSDQFKLFSSENFVRIMLDQLL